MERMIQEWATKVTQLATVEHKCIINIFSGSATGLHWREKLFELSFYLRNTLLLVKPGK